MARRLTKLPVTPLEDRLDGKFEPEPNTAENTYRWSGKKQPRQRQCRICRQAAKARWDATH